MVVWREEGTGRQDEPRGKNPLLQKILWLQQGQESESSTVPWGVGQRRWLGILDTSLNFSLVGLRELFDGVRGRGGRNGWHLPRVEESKLRQPVQWLPWETFQHTLLLIACIWIAHLMNCLIYSSRHLSLACTVPNSRISPSVYILIIQNLM